MRKKTKNEEKKEKKEMMKKENQRERYIIREYKKIIKEFEKMPHLSDLRDELKEQKDEGLMAYVKESIVVDEEELTRLNVARLNKKVLKIWQKYTSQIV